MDADRRSHDSFRGLVTAFAIVGIGWQVTVIALAFRHAVPLATVTSALGIDLPVTTRSFLATYRWWLTFPILSVTAAYTSHRASSTAPKRAIAAAVVPLILAALLQTWMNEAVLAPLRAILANVR